MRHPGSTASDLLLSSQAARLLGVSVQTIKAWDRLNRLKPVMRTTTGVRLYSRADLEVMRVVLAAERDAAAESANDAA
jgi:DNA-binding transcriptional MerR regulator